MEQNTDWPGTETVEIARTQDSTSGHATAVPGVSRQQETPFLRHGCRCGARWEGYNTAHCGAQCHKTFSSPRAFDRHRSNGQCRPPADAGLVEIQRIGYVVWGYPADDRVVALHADREATDE
jgi:hypothetical protein